VTEGSEIVGGGLDTGTGGATDLTGALCAVNSSGGTLAVLPQQPIGSGSQGETWGFGVAFLSAASAKGGEQASTRGFRVQFSESLRMMARAQVPKYCTILMSLPAFSCPLMPLALGNGISRFLFL